MGGKTVKEKTELLWSRINRRKYWERGKGNYGTDKQTGIDG